MGHVRADNFAEGLSIEDAAFTVEHVCCETGVCGGTATLHPENVRLGVANGLVSGIGQRFERDLIGHGCRG